MDSDPQAEGWYDDPYGLHEHRWFSVGRPTKLVEDNGVESYEEPPDEPSTGPLVRASSQPGDGRDMRRADERQNGGVYDPKKAGDAAMDAATAWFPTV
jgi:hypothetical protein